MSLARFKEIYRRDAAAHGEKNLGAVTTPILDDIKELLDRVRSEGGRSFTTILCRPNGYEAEGFSTHVTSDAYPEFSSAIFVGHEEPTRYFVVDERIKKDDVTRLHETFKVSANGIFYIHDTEPARWLSTHREDKPLINHLKSLIRDVERDAYALTNGA